jgi:hypothetical protein
MAKHYSLEAGGGSESGSPDVYGELHAPAFHHNWKALNGQCC